MADQTKKKQPMRAVSPVFALHYVKFIFRCLLFLFVLLFYCLGKQELLADMHWFWGGVWLLLFGSILLRFFPSRFECMGAQKQLGCHYEARPNPKTPKTNPRGIAIMLALWLGLTALVGTLYALGVFGRGFLLLLTLFVSILDVFCILFFCPFQTWILKNRCCTTCRIYNWDYAMMLSPILFVPSFYTYTLYGAALALLIQWEVEHHRHPERFYVETNACLDCSRCEERLCKHKKQLRTFIRKQRMISLTYTKSEDQAVTAVEKKTEVTVGAVTHSGDSAREE